MTLSLQELTTICQAQLKNQTIDNSLKIQSAADIMNAEPNQLTVLSSPKYAKYLSNTKASACLISEKLAHHQAPDNLILLYCDDPEISFLNAVKALHPSPELKKSISEQAVIAESAKLANSLHIGPYSTIGENTVIGENSEIFASVHIGQNVKIGKNCRIYPNVVIYDHCEIGDHVILHSGAIIGADGFGYKYRDNVHVKVPHVGNVIIADHVEIGANTCIDRGALGSTEIGAGSKIDNLVQLGHNNQLGRNVIICGQSGISGSCKIDDGAILAGSSGIADHVHIGSQAIVMARSGVSNDINAGTQVFGSPAKDKKLAWRELAALTKLPELLKKIKELELRITSLEK